jgi:Methyltransferase domain
MLNWSLRYLPVVALLDELGAEQVLDVGSGWHGLSRYRSGPVVQTDLQFAGARPSEAWRDDAQYVRASAERLPFRDAAFDYVVSLDLMEHLPSALRAPAVRELARVADRGVILGFPCGPEAARVDRRLQHRLQQARRDIPDWLGEHLAQTDYPDERTVVDALPVDWAVKREVPLGNVHLLGAVVLAEQLPFFNRIARHLDDWYCRRGPIAVVDRGRTYRRVWLIGAK